MLHCFSAIHSSCLKVPASKGEEDTFLFLSALSVRICVCANLSLQGRQEVYALNETNMADPWVKDGCKGSSPSIKAHNSTLARFSHLHFWNFYYFFFFILAVETFQSQLEGKKKKGYAHRGDEQPMGEKSFLSLFKCPIM